uniref:TRP C-terminal domain-containing protein n=1 Tax=Tetradesmus obliquus TaxID=3088 RepID=A0A383VKX8_TETOB|eukprot:jgi/Sobl393_1/15411/SZX65831.1
MQYALILASVTGVELPAALAYPLQALAWAWSPAVPETLSIECILPHGSSSSIPVSIQRMLFYLAMPFAMLVLFLVVDAFIFRLFPKKQAVAVGLRDKLGGSAMVVCFFFMPSILRSAFGWFACIPIDAPIAAPYAAGAVGSFWLQDPSQLCYQGYHRAWALGLGLPLLLLVCGLLPASIVWVVHNKQRLNDPLFMRHYGFLVRFYKPAYCWLEAAVLMQTAALTAVGVFSYSLRPLQERVMCAALAVCAIALRVFQPYAQSAAGRTMLAGMYCVLLTSLSLWSFTAFREFSPSVAYVLAMGVLLLVLNLAYVVAVVWQIVKMVDWQDVWQKVARAFKAAVACAAGVACAKTHARKQQSCTTAVDGGSPSSRP